MNVRRAVHNLWFIVRPSDDIPGDWEAHCLEFDLVAQGQTLGEALELVVESCAIHVRESLRSSCDPYATRAPDECWSFRDSVISNGEKLSPEQFHSVLQGRQELVLIIELPVVVDIDFHIVDGPDGPTKPEPTPQLVWKRAA
jgi:hypothetical protein